MLIICPVDFRLLKQCLTTPYLLSLDCPMRYNMNMNIFARMSLINQISKIYGIDKKRAKALTNYLSTGLSTREAINIVEKGLYEKLIDSNVKIYDIYPEIGKQFKWNTIAGMIFNVLDFDMSDTYFDSFSQAQNDDFSKPYGYLIVQSPTISLTAKLPIIHRDDFMLAYTVFGDNKLKKKIIDDDKYELLVTYAPESMNSAGYSLTPLHCLHFSIEKSGSLEEYYDGKTGTTRMQHPEPEIIFGKFIYGPGETIEVKNIGKF